MNITPLRWTIGMILVFAAHAVSAECPEGKSVVVLMTPSGNVKNICVADAAIPGIENAAENAPLEIAPACPCEDLWNGIYDQNTVVTGTPPYCPKTCQPSSVHSSPQPTLVA